MAAQVATAEMYPTFAIPSDLENSETIELQLDPETLADHQEWIMLMRHSLSGQDARWKEVAHAAYMLDHTIVAKLVLEAAIGKW